MVIYFLSVLSNHCFLMGCTDLKCAVYRIVVRIETRNMDHRLRIWLHIQREERENGVNPRIDRVIRDRDNPLDYLSDETFLQRFRLNRQLFYELLDMIDDRIVHQSNRNMAVSPALQLLSALRFYASGSFEQVVGDTVHIHKSTVCRIIKRVTEALLAFRGRFIQWPSRDECRAYQQEMHENHGFPCVEGCIDGTHIRIVRPQQYEEAYVNRKNYHSINVQVVSVGADLRITDVVANWPGSTHDAFVLRQSGVHQRFQEHQLPRTPNGVLLGDSAYPLLPWLMTPFIDHPNMTVSVSLSHFFIVTCIFTFYTTTYIYMKCL